MTSSIAFIGMGAQVGGPMPLDEDEHTPEAEEEVSDAMSLSGARKWWKLPLLFLLAVLLLVAGLGWLNREQVADNLIASQLDSLGIPARYKIKEIGTARQVLEQVVIGDPARPDLTIERVEVKTVMRFGLPRFGHVTLVKPRLFGSYREGKLSFGSLDSVIFSESEEPFVLPDLDLVIQDGRGLIECDFGPVGIKTEGSGRLQDGFAGTLAVTAPILANEECSASDVSLYGKLSISGERPRFAGPCRFAGSARSRGQSNNLS
ncbi:MAG: hypothetical protein P8J20_00935 [Novosphingobium sp.]|nr:hypothetical protein [Novosphingobium sp.]